MRTSIISELPRFVTALTILALIGLVFGGLAWWLLTGLSFYVGLCIYRIKQLTKAVELKKLAQVSFEDDGIWENLLSALNRQQQESQQHHNRLSRRLERYQTATQALPNGVVVIGGAGEIEAFNDNAALLIGLKSPADIGRPISNYLRRPEFTRFFERSDVESSLTIDSPSQHGRRLQLQVVKFAQGQQRLMTVRDVTRLESLEIVRRDFVANVSHELKTPLTVIRGYNENLSRLLIENVNHNQSIDESVRPVVERSINEIQAHSQRMGLLIDDLLELSRLEADDDTVDVTIIRMSPLFNTIKHEAVALCSGTHEINVHLDESLMLRGNEKEIYSAFSNIVFNAIRYSTAPGAINLSWSLGENGNGIFEVEDHGPGIPVEDVPRVTERFYRVDKSRSRGVGGTGLGLAIAKHVMIRHDGEIRIDSQIGVGTTVVCEFDSSRIVRADLQSPPTDSDRASIGTAADAGQVEQHDVA